MVAAFRSLIRAAAPSSHLLKSHIPFSTALKTSHHNNHQQNHIYLEPNSFLNSWEVPKDPKEAEARLAQLRRNYAKQVKERRKEYIREVEMMKLEKQRKDEARREAIRVVNEERRKAKAEAAKVRAEQRKVFEEEFRQTILKERAEKLEHWRNQMKSHKEKKEQKKKLLHCQSSKWIDEQEDLEKQTLAAITHFTELC